jgi:flagellar hook-associated protein 1 FlgK
MSAALNIASRALVTNQSVLQVIGHNIANVNTPGYSRQSVNLATAGAQQYANGYFGKGVEIATVTRAYDAHLAREAVASRSVAATDAVRLSRLQQLEAAFPMGEAGLGEALNAMLNAWVDVVSAPANQTARLVVIARADTLANRVRDTAAQLDALGESTSLQVAEVVTKVNRLAAQLAQVNRTLSEAASSPHAANDVLDQRDRLLAELSQHVQLHVVMGDDGAASVFVGGSMPLVLGTQAQELVVGHDPVDTTQWQVGFRQGGATTLLPDASWGGELGGMLRFLNEDLTATRNYLGRMALATASLVNAQHALGINAQGRPGADFFVPPQPAEGLTGPGNVGDALIRVRVADATALVASDYELQRRADGVSVRRLADGSVFHFEDPVTWPLEVDGLRFDLEDGEPAVGDTFRFKPYEAVARNLHMALAAPDRLAAASPVVVAPGASNAGGLTVEGLYAVAAHPDLTAPASIVFEADGSYRIDGGPSQPFVPGQPIVHNGWSLTLRGTPAAGDRFDIGVAPGGAHVHNAGNAQAMLGLRTLATFEGVPLADGYVTLFSDLGTRVQDAQFASRFSAQVASTAEDARANATGVNLDEEAARLLQFQHAYQAAAKYLQVAQGLFDSLLQTVTR